MSIEETIINFAVLLARDHGSKLKSVQLDKHGFDILNDSLFRHGSFYIDTGLPVIKPEDNLILNCAMGPVRIFKAKD